MSGDVLPPDVQRSCFLSQIGSSSAEIGHDPEECYDSSTSAHYINSSEVRWKTGCEPHFIGEKRDQEKAGEAKRKQ